MPSRTQAKKSVIAGNQRWRASGSINNPIAARAVALVTPTVGRAANDDPTRKEISRAMNGGKLPVTDNAGGHTAKAYRLWIDIADTIDIA
jgi:hypothetical protein